MTTNVIYILASVVLVLVVGFVANYLLALHQNRNAPHHKERRPPLKGPETG
jgi:hypothetical protein